MTTQYVASHRWARKGQGDPVGLAPNGISVTARGRRPRGGFHGFGTKRPEIASLALAMTGASRIGFRFAPRPDHGKSTLSIMFLVILALGSFLLVGSYASAWGKVLCTQDSLGRKVCLRVPVKRVVFLIDYEFVPYLDLWGQTVGVSFWARFHRYWSQDPRAQKIKVVGTPLNPNFELIRSLTPDLVITWAYTPKNARFLQDLGCPTLALAPQGLTDLFAQVKLLGELFGREPQAGRLAQRMRLILEMLKTRVAHAPRTRVLFLWNQPTRIAGRYGVVPDLIRTAGGKNLGDALPLPYANVSIERIVAWNPEVIFIWGSARFGAQDLLKDSRFQTIEAVKNKKVFKLPYWSTWSPKVVVLAVWMARHLHPQRVSARFYQKTLKLILPGAL